jgi:hypothetical protein
MESQTIRNIWIKFTSAFSVGKIPNNPKIRVFTDFETVRQSGMFASLVQAYIEVFRESWGEIHKEDDVIRRIERQMSVSDSALVILVEQDRVVGFTWAGILNGDQIVDDCIIEPSFSSASRGDWDGLRKRLNEELGLAEVVFVYEMGILRDFRGNIQNLALLFGNILMMGWVRDVHGIVWWTSFDSRGSGLAEAMGFELIHQVNDLPFYYLDDFEPLLIAITRLSVGVIQRLLGFRQK